MNVFLVIISSIIFLASFPMFTYAFVVPEQFAIALFTGGILTASLAFVIPLVFLSRSDR
jgi:isoprenylcysteine carboxyl methyltransferase (ICMT) family protein YpbQ